MFAKGGYASVSLLQSRFLSIFTSEACFILVVHPIRDGFRSIALKICMCLCVFVFRFRNNPRNYAMKKTGLMKDKLEAEVEGDIERLSKVQNDLNELEERAEMLDKQRTKNISAVT